MTNYDFQEGPLNILVSARIRLTNDQRAQLKAAYQALRNAAQPPAKPTIGNSPVRVETAFINTSDLDRQVGMSFLTFSDLVNSRETVSLPVMLDLQSRLGIEVISQQEVSDSCAKYCSYVFSKYAEQTDVQDVLTA